VCGPALTQADHGAVKQPGHLRGRHALRDPQQHHEVVAQDFEVLVGVGGDNAVRDGRTASGDGEIALALDFGECFGGFGEACAAEGGDLAAQLAQPLYLCEEAFQLRQ